MTQQYPHGDQRPPHNSGGPGRNSGHGFWTSLPGILTGVAAVVASIGGLIGALFAAGVIGGSGGNDDITPVQTAPTATTQVQQVATQIPTVFVPAEVTSTSVFPAPQEIDIEGVWSSQGGFSWVISQSGLDVEVASLDIIGTSYFGIRTDNTVRITQVSDGFSVAPSSGSMTLQANGEVMNVEINGVPDIMVRQ